MIKARRPLSSLTKSSENSISKPQSSQTAPSSQEKTVYYRGSTRKIGPSKQPEKTAQSSSAQPTSGYGPGVSFTYPTRLGAPPEHTAPRGSRPYHNSPSHIHYSAKEKEFEKRKKGEHLRELGPETQEYVSGMPGAEPDALLPLPKHYRGKSSLEEAYKEVPNIEKYPEMFDLIVHFESVTVQSNRIPGIQSMPPNLAATIELASRVLFPQHKNYKMLRHPSLLEPSRQVKATVDSELDRPGGEDNNISHLLISFVFGILSNAKEHESALQAGLRKWSASPPEKIEKVIKMVMEATMKDKGLTADQMKEVMESDSWKELMRVSNSIPHGEFLAVSIPKEKAQTISYPAGRRGTRLKVSMEQFVSDEPPIDELMGPGEGQWRLMCSERSLRAGTRTQMHFVNFGRKAFEEHLKDKPRTSIKEHPKFKKIIPHATTAAEKESQKLFAQCDKLIEVVRELIQTKAEENAKLRDKS